MAGRVEVVFLDVGGVVYDDATYFRAMLQGLRDLAVDVPEAEVRAVYDRGRQAQAGSIRAALARRFLGDGEAGVAALAGAARRHWTHPAEALLPDVLPCLAALDGRFRLGVLANQPGPVRDALRRDGLAGYFTVWAVSEDVGHEKPDPRLFLHALAGAGVQPGRAVMVGNRLDMDVRPARAAGMRTVWVVRGEAPDHPTPEQLAEPDRWVAGLVELPAVLEELDAGGS
jgi:HAD superfamily hydrolase (TIGR01509 family)